MLSINIPLSSSSTTSIQQAFYKLAPYADFQCKMEEEHFYINIHPIKDKKAENIAIELKRHINDYWLREILYEKTGVVRGLLYAQAFSQVGKDQST